MLANDTDCQDDTPARGTSGGWPDGPVCPQNTPLDPGDFTENGDSIAVSSCLNNNCTADGTINGQGFEIPLDLDPDGNIELDLLSNGELNIDAICEAQETVIATYNYQITDARGESSSNIVEFQIDPPSNPNNRPERDNRDQTFGPITSDGDTVSGDVDDQFIDPDGDSLDFDLRWINDNNVSPFDIPNSAFDLNESNGSWTFTAPNGLTDSIPQG